MFIRLLPAAIVAAGIVALSARPAHAQRASVSGVVKDSAARPVANVDVVATPGNHRTRTDSAGMFNFTDLDGDTYTVRARKIGFAPVEGEASVSKGGHANMTLTMDHGMAMLDTITVVAGRPCPMYSLDGFVCRRHKGTGTFFDYTDIDDKAVPYTADLFQDMPGFREGVVPTRYGPTRVPQLANGFGCIAQLVDGHPAGGAYIVPSLAGDLVAMEVYTKPEQVPPEFQQYTWPRGDVTRTGRCAVVNYWTLWAPMTHR
ncbi:MAG TPA: carboxypeptidase-like regulatory domain-containing protein [Gemmatimonadaceae bacterium]|jgi:hypothetical protein|nr:carboxypeptidase-like regulatory domain-containing protein [Gemmatimonadaceae bacterium]